MHLGFLTSDLSHRSGWAHYSLSLLLALRRAGVRMTVVCSRNSPDVDGLGIHRLLPNLAPSDRFSLLRMALAVPQARAVLRDCDMIHTTAELFAPLGDHIAGNRPHFITGHGSYVRVDRFRSWPVNALYRRAFYRARVICVSRYTAGIAQGTMPGLHTIVVNNGIDVERFQTMPSLDSPPNRPTVLTVGGVKARKGTLELVRAMAVVRQHIPDVQCVVIGRDDAEPLYAIRVRQAIAELGLANCVQVLGMVPEQKLMGWYSAADVFVLPSMNIGWKFEGYGLTHIEASAAGLPVIGTTGCGAEDAVDDGVTGLLVPQDQIEHALPQAILALLTDQALAKRMGAAGREKAQRQTWDHVARQMITVYQGALSG